MFCEESILRVYQRRCWDEIEKNGCDSLLRLTHSFEYRTMNGHWLVFETANHVISVGYDGVKKYASLTEFAPEDELEPWSDLEDWEMTEHTLFVGEHLHSVQQQDGYVLLTFDDFVLKLFTYNENEWKKLFSVTTMTHNYRPMVVGNHLLKRKCNCGGDGEILIDFVDDYEVRCNKCHASTWAGMCLIDAIEDWNRGDTPITLHTGEEKFLQRANEEGILYVALENENFWQAKYNLCDAAEFIVVFSDTSFLFTCISNGDDQFDFEIEEITNYHPKHFSHEIRPQQNRIQFIGFETEDGDRMIRFDVDGSHLLITPRDRSFMIGFTWEDTDGQEYEMKRVDLFPQGGRYEILED